MQVLNSARYDRGNLDDRDDMRYTKMRKGAPVPSDKPVREVQSRCDLACSQGTDASSDRVERVERRRSEVKQRGHGAAEGE